MNFVLLQVFYAAFSGIIEAFAISNELMPLGSPFLALFCLAPLYRAIYRSKSYRESFFLFFIQILTVHMISSYWLANFHGFAAFTLGASAAGTAVQGGFFGLIAHIYPKSIDSRKKLAENAGADSFIQIKRILWFSMVWVIYEYEKSTGAMGYPWGTVSMAAYKWKIFTQISDITGVWGITFIYTVFSCVFAECLELLGKCRADKKVVSNCLQSLYFALSLFIASGIYGIIQYNMPREILKNLNAVIVQQNVDPWESGDEESIRISKKLTDAAVEEFKKSGTEPDLVVWSEGVLGKNFPSSKFYYANFPEGESLQQYIKKLGTPFLIGGGTLTDAKRHRVANSAILFDRNGEYSGFYSKIQLVPFAEKIPYSENPLMHAFMKNVVGFASTLTSGFQYVLFRVPLKEGITEIAPLDTDQKPWETIALDSNGVCNYRDTEKYIYGNGKNPYRFVDFTTPICFEDSFASVCRNLYRLGSEVFLNITNDSWSKTNSAEMQHFIIASYLATEFRTTLVRCANSGYSVVVDPSGKVVNSLPLFEETSAAWVVPIYERKETYFYRYGDWLPLAFCTLLFAYMIYILAGIWIDFSRIKNMAGRILLSIAKEMAKEYMKSLPVQAAAAEKEETTAKKTKARTAKKSAEKVADRLAGKIEEKTKTRKKTDTKEKEEAAAKKTAESPAKKTVKPVKTAKTSKTGKTTKKQSQKT